MRFSSLNFQEVTSLALNERGFSYGDGHFTTAFFSQGKVEFLNAHIDRLKLASHSLGIDGVKWPELITHIKFVAQNHTYGVLKIIITAGNGGRGYGRIENAYPNVYVFVFDVPAHYTQWQWHGITLGVAEYQLGINPTLAGIKHLNRLEQVFIRNELDNSQKQDLVVTDCQHNVIEASCANIFWLIDETWHTPKLVNAGVKGIVYGEILRNVPMIKQVSESIEVLAQAKSIFICNAIMGIVPIAQFNGDTLDMQPVFMLADSLGIHRFEPHDKPAN